MAASRTIAIRLTLEEADQFRAAFKAAGADGEAALNKLRQASSAAMGKVGTDADGATEKLKLQKHEWTNLSFQLQDFAVQVGSGQGIFRPLIQQGPQAVGAVGGVKNALTLLGQIFTPLRAGALLVAGGVTAMVVAAEAADTRLVKLRNSLVGYTNDYAALASRIDASSRKQAGELGISSSNVRSAQTAVVQALPGLSDVDVQRSVELGQKLALTLDQDIGTAVQRLGQIAKDPAAAIKALAEQGVPGLSASLVTQIDLMQRSGDRTGAYRAALQALLTSLGGAQMSAAQKATASLTGEWERFWQGIENGLAGPGSRFTSWMAQTLKEINDFREKSPTQQAQAYADAYRGAGVTFPDRGNSAPITSRDLARVPGDVPGPDGRNENAANRIYRIAEANGIDPKIADLGTRVVYRESRGLQLDPKTGQVLTSSAGALGLGQLMPGTAKQYGVDPKDPDQNVLGMLRYLTDLSKDPRFPTESDVAGAYNAGPAGYARARASGQLPAETAAYIPAVTGRRRDIDGPPSNPPAQFSPDYIRTAEAARTTLEGRRQGLTADIKGTEAALATATATGDQDAITNLNGWLRDQRAELEKLRTPVQDYIKGLTDQADAAKDTTGASGEISKALADLNRVARDGGWQVTEAERADVVRLTLSRLSAEYKKTNTEIARSTGFALDLAHGWDQSNDAGRRAEAQQKAYADAIKVAKEGTPAFVAALESSTQARLKEADATRAASVAAGLAADRQQGDTLRLQNSLATSRAGPDETSRALAEQRATQSLEGVTDPETRAKKMAISRENEDLRLRNVNIMANQTELETFMAGSADRIGSSITDAFVQGQSAAVTFSGITKAVLSDMMQEFVKLAAINPLKNLLLGTNSALPTLFSLGGGGGAGAGGISAFEGAGTTALVAHSGAIVGHEYPSTRMLPSSTWDGARKLHGGGLASDEIPAVLQAGEGVFTKNQMKALAPAGGGGASIQADFHYHAASGGDTKPPSDEELARASKTWARNQEANIMAIIARERSRPGGSLWR